MFNFYCYTLCAAMPTQKSAWKWCCHLSWLLVWKITKGIHSCKPASLNRPIGCPKMHFLHELMIFWSAKKQCKDTFFSILHPLSLVIFATATVVAFVLLHNSKFNFHCYTQREATNTYSEISSEVTLQPLVTSCTKDYKGHSLMQTSFTELPNITT